MGDVQDGASGWGETAGGGGNRQGKAAVFLPLNQALPKYYATSERKRQNQGRLGAEIDADGRDAPCPLASVWAFDRVLPMR
jgi:hypothetical protein